MIINFEHEILHLNGKSAATAPITKGCVHLHNQGMVAFLFFPYANKYFRFHCFIFVTYNFTLRTETFDVYFFYLTFVRHHAIVNRRCRLFIIYCVFTVKILHYGYP